MKHKKIKKEIRYKVYKKYDGHCAYCGQELDFSKMQVDHLIPVYWTDPILKDRVEEDIETLENYMPSCRRCNFYKNSKSLEAFRYDLSNRLLNNLRKTFNYKLAMQYGIIKENIEPIKFYFEVHKCKKEEKS